MFASPVVLEILSSFAEDKLTLSNPILLSSLKRIITAGAPATIPLQQKFRNLLDDHTDLFGIYGATETLPIAKVESREIFSLKEKTEHGAGICLGKPIDGVTVRIIPITDEPIEEWQDSLTVEAKCRWGDNSSKRSHDAGLFKSSRVESAIQNFPSLRGGRTSRRSNLRS